LHNEKLVHIEEFFHKDDVLKAKDYKKESFINDISKRAEGVLGIQNIDKFKEKLSLSYSEMKAKSKVFILDESTVSDTMYALKMKYESIYKASDELYQGVVYLDHLITEQIVKNMMHRLILEDVLDRNFKDLEFNLTEWDGLEFPTATGGGFGERTTFETIEYRLERTDETLKQEFFCSVAVYFKDILSVKQTYEYKEVFLKDSGKYDKERLDNMVSGIRNLRLKDYE